MVEQKQFFLKYLPIKITLTSMKKATLPPFIGSTLRGVIGQALYSNQKAYNMLYKNNNRSGEQHDILNPYMIIPPKIGECTYQPEDELSFDIILFGDAVKYAKVLMDVLVQIKVLGLGAYRYPFLLEKISHAVEQRIIWDKGNYYNLATNSVILPYKCLSDVKELIVYLRTPLRIRRNGIFLEEIDFQTIIRNITHRIDMLTVRCGGWVDKEEIEKLIDLSSEITLVKSQIKMKNMKRYSNRLEEKMDFGGLMGMLHFKGDITPFVPWLYAAQILHIGGNTTFGMGQIEIEFK